MSALSEGVPPPSSPEQPPNAPYDPPQPAPQAAAWRRALKVIAHAELERHVSVSGARSGRTWTRGGAH